ncbi:MlaA family lipoprotein [Motiliproteus sediminis]|uniref:MlaA family lipoprotein n=1 Tax=Motiliproteus sediminis TaxID=1468178 RepID=UPI001AF01F21|nr:VacJ family lipoprotein [Motiliproteus sediminis]
MLNKRCGKGSGVIQRVLLWVVVLGWVNGAAAEEVNPDPWEGFNRKMFAFNEAVDEYLWLPATKGYRYITPEPVQRGVHNFVGNLNDVVSLFSNILQLKFHNSMQDLARVVVNTTFGLGGLFDVATPAGVAKQHEEFGQVLGYWGVPSGPYLVLPFLGPSNIRDGFSWLPNAYLHPVTFYDDESFNWSYTLLYALDLRSELMKSEALISGDRYTFIRDAYMQRREYLVNDGQIDDIYGDDGF